ncbi:MULTISPECIES: aldo/keto reductase [Microbacterium]|uniref:aldo/keto reductase n=1 Tax=Microbacterium TaxID=33882 RepID=UPI0008DA2301|nr:MULTISPECIES: aldo/keto reductase [Microbacterium]MAY50448.1 aldo/keto reductase [Microbacterium sp.]HAS32293.1 aldo/keto reductase [Microbacterium sp.]HBS73391.1 aldo/keto reductase [Microbacterium sp.]|tara:strand:+ start:112 stop:1002 length:891 start_codon:yes stop_codon:yes gene_type:complete
MKNRTLGPYTVSAIGLGAMPVSMNRDNTYPARDDAIAMIHAALDAGVTLIDTADIYAPADAEMGHNEQIVRDALASWGGDTDGIVVATKGGIVRQADGGVGRDGSLPYLRSAVEKSLRNLGIDAIDLYQYHRPDRWMVYGDIMDNLKTLREEGKVQQIGISNASVEEIDIARQVLGEGVLVSVQNEFSPKHPGSYDELQHCAEHGIAFLPWSPLGGTGGGARDVGERFGAFAAIADDHGVSPQQVVLAWELSLADVVIPIPGARRPASITDSARAADLQLSDDELSRCSAAVGLEV